MSSGESASTTLFVSDLPLDLHEADFVAAFKNYRGFVTARLRQDKNDRPVGFVEFEDHDSASSCRDAMNDHTFSRGDRGISIQFSNPSRPSKRSRGSASRGGSEDPYSGGSGYSSRHPPSYSHHPAPPAYGYYPGYSGAYPPAPPPASYMYNSLPSDASSTLFVEGLPSDATVREVSHIFRVFPGYQSLRILPKESKTDPSKVFTLCFVEFDSKIQSTTALHSLQGYRMDDKDAHGLRISYARSSSRRSGGGGDRDDRRDRRDRSDDRDKKEI